MMVDPDLWLVASGTAGFDLTDRLDCNVWVVGNPEGNLIFDAGAGIDVDASIRRGLACGIDWDRPNTILLTHAHADHAGGAAAWRERLGAEVLAGTQTADWLEAGDEQAVSLPSARAAGVYPANYRLTPCPVARRLVDGERFEQYGTPITPLATPGHSADHLSYLVETPTRTLLIAGDAVFSGGKVVLQDTWDCDIPATIASIRKLGDLAFDALLPGHQSFSLTNGRRHVQTALDRIDRLLCPELLA